MAKGHIEQLPSGSFRAVVSGGKSPITGEKIYLKSSSTSEAAAQLALVELLAAVEADAHPEKSATVKTLLEAWLEVVNHDLSTRTSVLGYIRRNIIPTFGDMPLRKLQRRVDLLDRYYAHLRRCGRLCTGPFIEHSKSGDHECTSRCRPHVCNPLAPATVRKIHAILSGALGYAVAWRWIECNPAEMAHPPKLNRRKAKPQSPDQVAQLLNAAWEQDIEMAIFLWLAATTGARRGELVALSWSDVDLERAVLTVDKSYTVSAGRRELKGTKTDNERKLAVDALTISLLREYRRQRVEALNPAGLGLCDSPFVFSPDPMCVRPWHPDHFTHTYRKLADPLGIVEPMKNLRQFNATQLLAAGVDLPTTAGRLGHSDGGATTLKIYASWQPGTDRAAIEHLSATLAEKQSQHGREIPTAAYLSCLTPPLDAFLSPPVDGRTTFVIVAEDLRAAIGSGKLAPGTLLPTTLELSHWYGIARSTAHRALAALGVDGMACKSGQRWKVASEPAA